jgi:hypothetical protein
MMLERSIQLLACEFHLLTDTETVAERIDGLRPSAVQDHEITRRYRLEILSERGGYRVREGNRAAEFEGELDAAVAFLDRRLHELAFDALAGFTKIHAGCGRWNECRFLVVGNKGAGKSTLMTRLLFENACAVEGDEMVLVNDGQVVAYPRRFGIRRQTLQLIPDLSSLPINTLSDPGPDELGGFHVLALDPAQLGCAWHIRQGPAHFVFFMAARHMAPTRLTPCAPQMMAQRLLAQSAPPSGGSSQWIRDIGALVRNAATYELTIGDLDSAVACMRECIAGSHSQLKGTGHGERPQD